jgi:hypothetical protein
MSTNPLAVLILAPTAVGLARSFRVSWGERTSAPESRIAIPDGVVLAASAIVATMLARRGFLKQRHPNKVPAIAITLALVLLAFAAPSPYESFIRNNLPVFKSTALSRS